MVADAAMIGGTRVGAMRLDAAVGGVCDRESREAVTETIGKMTRSGMFFYKTSPFGQNELQLGVANGNTTKVLHNYNCYNGDFIGCLPFYNEYLTFYCIFLANVASTYPWHQTLPQCQHQCRHRHLGVRQETAYEHPPTKLVSFVGVLLILNNCLSLTFES